ncbi:MAG: hypothetical protein U1E65_13265 [Myxococcota bacterium]
MVPIVIDLGKAKAKELKALKNGAGPLEAEVQEALAQVLAELPADIVQGKRIVPVVATYKKKRGQLDWMFGR